MKKKVVFDVAKIVLCALLLSLNYLLFIVSNKFAPAGLNGIATMIQYKFSFSIGFFSLIINVPLCVFAFFFIDRDFAVKTLIFTLVYSVSYLLLQNVDLTRFQYDAGGVDTVYPCLTAGLISGFVYGIVFRADGSTGGTDVVSKFVSKKRPELNFFWITFAFNAVVAVLSFFVYAKTDEGGQLLYDYKPVMLCLLYCFTSSFVGNTVLKGSKRACSFTVITTHAKEIEQDILKELKHGATRFEGKGVYSGEERDVILCVVNQHQIVDFERILKKYDNTFAFMESVENAFGNFKKIK